eukprot:comp23019_c0_seq1/m.36744 comp23019_c0_seq1/g.36744  ORF comp23019_c0_seq1/g.36744 comp23019_c0_seq1/m.36744 type:complete len:376 (-) comp23019_c0_seq1:425-1552(-)
MPAASKSATLEGQKAFTRVPVIDFSLREKDEKEYVRQLQSALHHVGFFYLSNHGIDPALQQAMWSHAKSFFGLSIEQKLSIHNQKSPHFRGYSAVGAENTAGRTDYREQIDYGPEVAPFGGNDRSSVPAYMGLYGPNQFVDEQLLPGMKTTVLEYHAACSRLCDDLLEGVALALGQERRYFDRTFGSGSNPPHAIMKVLRYPPAVALGDEALNPTDGQEPALGVNVHTDYGYLTLLMQDDVGGLQALNPKGEWIDVAPIEGTYVINIGDMLQVMTHNYLVATPHRVVFKNPERERFCIPFFYNPSLPALCEQLSLPRELSGDEVGAQVASTCYSEYKEIVYGERAFFGFCRSHPKIRENFYPEYNIVNTQATPQG